MGTVGYMSPEQVRGKPADHRSDIFSFGAILYEMLSGQRAFRGESAADTITAILTKEPPDLSQTNKDIHPGLDRIVRHCLEKNPEERFESARDIAFDLVKHGLLIAPVVILTAFSQRDLVARARDAGAMAERLRARARERASPPRLGRGQGGDVPEESRRQGARRRSDGAGDRNEPVGDDGRV